MSRAVSLQVKTLGKQGQDGYKVDPPTAWLLMAHCRWKLTKKSKHYAYLRPPPGTEPGKRITVTVNVPSDDEIIAVAKELHAEGEHVRVLRHGWPFYYMPPHTAKVIIQYRNFFTQKDEGPPQVSESREEANCLVGIRGLWFAWIRWGEDDQPRFIAGTSPPSVAPEQLTLFSTLTEPAADEPPTVQEDCEAYEGTPYHAEHLRHERDRRLVEIKKAEVLRDTGKLACEVCGFDFAAAYGELGHGLIDCHHTKPVATLQPAEPTKLADLALVCCNCHRVLHRAAEVMTTGDLRHVVKQCRNVSRESKSR